MTPIVDLLENSPEKKKTKSIAGVQKKYNRYTTKGFTIPPTAHAHTHPLTYIEATIRLTSDDKPKEFIVALQSNLSPRTGNISTTTLDWYPSRTYWASKQRSL